MPNEGPIRISSFVSNTVYDISKKAIDRIFKDIDSIHWDGDLQRIGVSSLPKKQRKNGSRIRDASLDWESRDIYLNPDVCGHGLAVLHEVGHLVAIYGLGSGTPSCATLPLLGPWRSAVQESSCFKYQKSLAKEGTSSVVLGKQSIPYALDQEEMEYLQYVMLWEEIWARSYSQYMSRELHKRGISSIYMDDLQEESRSHVGRLFRLYWDDDDFETIAVTMREIIRYKGWIPNG